MVAEEESLVEELSEEEEAVAEEETLEEEFFEEEEDLYEEEMEEFEEELFGKDLEDKKNPKRNSRTKTRTNYGNYNATNQRVTGINRRRRSRLP